MNHEFRTSSTWTRVACACAAVLATVLVSSSIGGLIVHYSPDFHVASAQTVILAHR